LLATSQEHFDKVIDRLLESYLTGIDFNQGLDARLLTDHHAQRFAELPRDTLIRLAWDYVALEKPFMAAFAKLQESGIKPKQIRVYVMIGYKDTPEDARYRLEKVRKLGALPNPMRYQPLDALRRNSFVGDGWTELELKRFMRYYSQLKILRNVSFDNYTITQSKSIPDYQRMLTGF
jgi:hypothetical protein